MALRAKAIRQTRQSALLDVSPFVIAWCPPPPPPHHVYAKANSSSRVHLHWGRPAFTTGQTVNYTVRCNPVGLQNASLVLYLQTSEQSLLVQDLEPNTRYEFAVRLHVDQLSSPWSLVVYQTTLPEAPSQPPWGVKVTLIEDDTALVSWKQPEEPNLAVTRYTILYASRKALARRGVAGAAEGRFRHHGAAGEPAAREHLPGSQSGQNPRRSGGSAEAKAFSDGFYHMDQKSMTGIIVGVCIALACILLCVLILAHRGKARRSSAPKAARQGNGQAIPLSGGNQAENAEALMPMIASHFIDAKGGTSLIINHSGPVVPSSPRRKKWWFCSKEEQKDPRRGQAQMRGDSACHYQRGTTALRYDEQSPSSPNQTTSLKVLFGPLGDTEGSQNSEGSHETGDSGRFSHDETEMTNLSSGRNSRPPSLGVEDSGGSDDSPGPEEEPPHLIVEMGDSAEAPSLPHCQAPDPSRPALPL
ncbi:hypothetical protein SKAU_G00308730 [Synaphobranchus kaupii]|uniref:Fibronectin type-III domain-containing protein n=1 Tax=Synaphobranchus kaupii TaxID=118154 RepID=A0A9Q1ERF8_SYNKA|nr:hypothetical protein SKAU_G00308730 [Synaphobranchus kaupii]